ncbi:unnamed protein product, partial [Brassica oleracea]
IEKTQYRLVINLFLMIFYLILLEIKNVNLNSKKVMNLQSIVNGSNLY